MFFSSACGAFSRIDPILEDILSLSNFKKIESISKTISNHNTMGLKITRRKKLKNANMWRLNNILLKKNQWITEESKKCPETNENERKSIMI